MTTGNHADNELNNTDTGRTGTGNGRNDAGNGRNDADNGHDDPGELFPADLTIPPDVLAKLGNRYSHFQFIGSGATATVFQAHDNTLAKHVAIKILKQNSQADLIRFQKEARIASKLDHPNLICILNFDVTEENNAFIVMDVIQGDDLKTIVDSRKHLPPERALAVAYYIARGMAYAHSKKLAHRDLKSSNVMVQDVDSSDMKVIVVDFGLAKEQEQGKTGTAKVIGSPLYMSPEQAKGESADERADIYSLACIIYEMIAGSTPFQDDDLFKLLQKHAYEPAPKLSMMVPNTTLPEGLDELLLKMMEKDRVSRIQTMESVKQTILAIEQGKTGIIHKPAPKVPLKMMIGALAIIGIVFGACFFQLDAQRKASVKPKLTASEKLRVQKAARQEADMAGVHKYFEKDLGDNREQDGKLVRCVNLDATTDETLRFLPTTGLNLTKISLEGAHITGEGLRYLRGSGVKSLNLVGVKLSPKGWRQLNSLKSLEELILTESNISDDDLKNLHGNKHIKKLNLNVCKQISDASIDTLTSMKQLTSIFLAKSKVTDKLLEELAPNGSLTELDFEGTRVTDKGVEVLCQKNQRIDKLDVSNCGDITSKTVEVVAANEPVIKRLNIGFNKRITPESIRLLSACPKINDLSIHQIPIGKKELEVISKFKLLRLFMADVTFDESAFYLLQNQPTIEKLWITGPKITTASRKKLREMLPQKCNVMPMDRVAEETGFDGVYNDDPVEQQAPRHN